MLDEERLLVESEVHKRRNTDIQQEKIDALIAAEPDSKARLTLMVMSNINKSISANTDLTHAIHKEVKSLKLDLDTHIKDTEARKNRDEGTLRVFRIAGPLLWAVMAASVGMLYKNYTEFHTETSLTLGGISDRIQNIETTMVFYGIKETQLVKGAEAAPRTTKK